jgi:hypothetical protein
MKFEICTTSKNKAKQYWILAPEVLQSYNKKDYTNTNSFYTDFKKVINRGKKKKSMGKCLQSQNLGGWGKKITSSRTAWTT